MAMFIMLRVAGMWFLLFFCLSGSFLDRASRGSVTGRRLRIGSAFPSCITNLIGRLSYNLACICGYWFHAPIFSAEPHLIRKKLTCGPKWGNTQLLLHCLIQSPSREAGATVWGKPVPRSSWGFWGLGEFSHSREQSHR